MTDAERAARRRRLAAVFGDGLPDQTRDDLDDPGDRAGAGADDETTRAERALLREVPPHHGS